MKKINIVIPCFNEQDTLKKLISELKGVRKKLEKNYKVDVTLVNDGSSDNTQLIIKQLADKNEFIHFRQLAANAGHQAALRAGLDVCSNYDAVIMMDADLQHPPELIPSMIDAWAKGASVVQMVRNDSSKEAGFLKFATSKLYYKIINSISSLNMEYGASDFRLIDRSVVRSVISSKESDLFLRGYFSWLPANKISIKYKPAPRFAGNSKYTFKKMMNLASSGVLQFSEKPLQIAMNIGLVMAFASMAYAAYIAVRYFLGDFAVSGWTSLMVVLLFCFGINFILLGIIGRYLAHGLSLQKGRPEYIIASEKIRFSE